MVGVIGQPEATYLGIHRRAAGERPPSFLQHQHRRALRHDEAVPPLIERAAGVRRIFISGGHGADNGKSAEAQRGQRRLGSSRDHDVGLAPHDRTKSFSDGDSPGSAAHAVGRVGTGKAELDGDVAAGGTGEDGQGERRVDSAGP